MPISSSLPCSHRIWAQVVAAAHQTTYGCLSRTQGPPLPQLCAFLESRTCSFLSPPLLPDAGPGWQRCWGTGCLDSGRPGSRLSSLGVFSTFPFTAVVGETLWGAAVLLSVGEECPQGRWRGGSAALSS